MSNKPSITFVIPIFNSAWLLKDCLESIKKQNYPKNKIEIILPDGGSKDNGSQIGKKYGAKVIQNKKRLAEPGFMLGAQIAKGGLVVYMGADNRLVESDWIEKMVKPFADKKIIGAFPWVNSRKENTWLTKYFNAFTDPINHFILGSAANPLYFHRAYRTLKKTKDYIVYDFSLNNFPMLALDQGFTLRKSYKRNKDTEYDDILPVLDIIDEKLQLAYVPGASNYHDTLEKGVPQFSKKMRWIIDNNLFEKSTFGFPTRKKHLSMERKIRFYLWPIYAISILGPISYSLIGFIRDKQPKWIYHFPITMLMLWFVIQEIVRVGILKQPSLASRQ